VSFIKLLLDLIRAWCLGRLKRIQQGVDVYTRSVKRVYSGVCIKKPLPDKVVAF